jgi:uncharacterized membrane protein
MTSLRHDLQTLAAHHGLDAAASARLEQLAGLGQPPAQLARWLPLGVAVAGAALAGLGLMFWVAANWAELGRVARFALVQGALALAGLGAVLGARQPAARAGFGLATLLATGGLFALFGQTYQTGADAWQLFALWAALSLPLGLGARSDVLWAPWTLVAMTAVTLWLNTHSGWAWNFDHALLPVRLSAWLAAGGITLLVSGWLRRYTGAGDWSWRLALLLALGLVCFTALGQLFENHVGPLYALALAVVLALGAGLVLRRGADGADVFALSAVALALDTLLVLGLARAMLWEGGGRDIGTWLLLGLVAAGLLAATVWAVLRLARPGAQLASEAVGV